MYISHLSNVWCVNAAKIVFFYEQTFEAIDFVSFCEALLRNNNDDVVEFLLL